MLTDVQPDSPCLAICSLNGLGRQRPGESGVLVPVWGAGTWDAAEDEGLLQGQALDEVKEVMWGPTSWHPRCAGGTWQEQLQRCAPGGAGTAVPHTSLGRSPTDEGGRHVGRQLQPSCWGLLVFPSTRRRLKARCSQELCCARSEPGQPSPMARDRHRLM